MKTNWNHQKLILILILCGWLFYLQYLVVEKMMRNEINQLLDYVRKTNPTMTKEKLIDELSKNRYSSIALVMVAENIRQEK